MKAEPLPLFDAGEYAPRRARKEVAPGYRPDRARAQQQRDEELAAFRDHQRGCEQCANARATAEAKGRTKAHPYLCTDGYLAFRRFAVLNSGLLRGWYPDHDRPRPAPGPQDTGQEALW